MKIVVEVIHSEIPGDISRVERTLFDQRGEVTDNVTYSDACAQALVILRSALLAAYGFDKFEEASFGAFSER